MPIAREAGSDWQNIVKRFELVWRMVGRELHARYVGSVIGLFWSVVHPLITLLVYTYVFSYVLKVKFEEGGGTASFAIFLFCGMIPWLSFQETVTRCTTSITDNASLVKNLSFPSKVIQFSIAATALVTQLIGLGILIVAILVLWGQFPYLLLLVLPVALLTLVFSLGLGFVLCTCHVFFRDTAQIVGVSMMLWFYVTPIIYPARLIPERFHFIIYLNPLAYAASVYRQILLDNEVPEIGGFLIFSAVAFVTFLVGYRIYTKSFGGFIDEL